MTALTFLDVLRARELLHQHLPPTPMWSYPALNAAAGATLYVKHENVQPIGAFKARGGLNLMAGLSAADRARGVLTYSTGNHAQSIAYAAREFGIDCVVVMPAGANQFKANSVKALGATVVLAGAHMGEAQAHADKLAAESGAHLISPGDEPGLIAGVGTLYLEVLERQPDLDAIVVPIGSGTGAAAACLVAAAVAPGCRVIGVQSTESPAAHDSWRSGQCVERPDRTTVAGLATGRGFELPQRLLADQLADFVLVSDDQIRAAAGLLATHAHTLAEGAGAAPLAAVLATPELAGRRIAVICTGGNASAQELAGLSAIVDSQRG